MNLESTVALVSGGASGLGRATAEAAHARGAQVVVFDLPASAEKVPESSGLHFVGGDVREPADVERAISAASELGDLRVCVHTAAIVEVGPIAVDGVPLDLEQFRRVIDVNLIGTFNVSRLVAAAMQKTEPVDGERGVIINTASIAAFEGQIGQLSYTAAKGGVVSMTLPIARDLAESLIRCVTIAPGVFETPLLGDVPPEMPAAIAAMVPHPARMGRPEEFAQLALQIVENQMINGEVIRIDGAVRMGPR